jgi:hypothetical protein
MRMGRKQRQAVTPGFGSREIFVILGICVVTAVMTYLQFHADDEPEAPPSPASSVAPASKPSGRAR